MQESLMVGSSDGKMIVISGKGPWRKGVQANAVKCAVCTKGIHNMATAIQSFDANQHLLQHFHMVQYLF